MFSVLLCAYVKKNAELPLCYAINKLNMKKIQIFFAVNILFFSNIFISFSQNSTTIDSLQLELKKSSTITSKYKLFWLLATEYSTVNKDSSFVYYQKAKLLALKIYSEKKIADTNFQIALILATKGKNDTANIFLFKSIDYYEKRNDVEKIIQCNIAIGENYRALCFTDLSFQYIEKAIRLSFQNQIYQHLAWAYNRYASSYYEYYYHNFENTLIRNKSNFQKVIALVDTSIIWDSKMNSNKYLMSNYNILGLCYEFIEKYDLAYNYIDSSRIIYEKENNFSELSIVYRNLSRIYRFKQDYAKSIYYAEKGVRISDSLRLITNLRMNYFELYETYYKIADYKKSLKYFRLTDSILYTTYNEITISKEKEFQTKYESQKKQLLLEKNEILLKQKDNKFRLLLFIMFISGILLVMSIFVGIYFRKSKVKTEKQAFQLKKALSEIDQLNLLKNNIVSMIVHDLKNPLNTIINISNDLMCKNNGENIKKNALKMLNLVNDILDVRKLEENKMKILFSENNLNQTIREAFDLVVYMAEQKNINIRNNIDCEIIANFDKELILRVIINLLTNAIKFSENNSEILFNYKLLQQKVKIEITDFGTGIPLDLQDKIFEKYEQIQARNLGFNHSTGIGLTFCKLVINAHNQTIGLESEINKGSTFWFTLELLAVNEILLKENFLKTKQISKNLYEQTVELRSLLSKKKVYEASDIFELLTNCNLETEEFLIWAKEIKNAVLNNNTNYFLKLINEKNCEF